VYPAGGQAPNVPGDMAAMEASLRNRIVARFADTTARDAAYTGLTSSQKQGILCWIDNRAGHCYWDPTGSGSWQWMSVHRKVTGGTRASAADSASVTPGVVIPLAAVALPSGNRLLHVVASGVIQNLSGSGSAIGRLFVTPGLPDGDNYLQASLGPGEQNSVSRDWYLVASGTVQYQLSGLMVSGTASGVRFTNTWMQVFDLGACDD
jgi:hypothetical protein